MPYLFDWLRDHPWVCIVLTSVFIAIAALALTQAVLEAAGYRTVIQ